MAVGLTQSQKQILLNEYYRAERAILKGQAYTIKDRSLTRADLRWVQEERRKLENEIVSMNNEGGVKVRRVLFRDL